MLAIGLKVREQFDLTDRKAIVVGAGGGIGRELCHALAEMGADVALVDNNRESIKRVAKELRKYGRQLLISKSDITKSNDVKNMVNKVLSKWKRIDILVNCAE